MMDDACLINNVIIIKRNRTKDKSTRIISYLSVDHLIILFWFLLEFWVTMDPLRFEIFPVHKCHKIFWHFNIYEQEKSILGISEPKRSQISLSF